MTEMWGPPQSRELRLHSGETDDLETLLLGVQQGGTTELIKGIVATELYGDGRYAQGVHAVSYLVTQLLMREGYTTIAKVREQERRALEDDLLGPEDIWLPTAAAA